MVYLPYFSKSVVLYTRHVIPARGVVHGASRGTRWHLGSGLQKHHKSQTRPLPRSAVAFLHLDLGWCCRTETSPAPGPDFNALLLRDSTPAEARFLVDWNLGFAIRCWSPYRSSDWYSLHTWNYWMWNDFVCLSQSAIFFYLSFLQWNRWKVLAALCIWVLLVHLLFSCEFIYLFVYLLPPETFPVRFFPSFHPCLPLFLSPSRICYNYLKEDSTHHHSAQIIIKCWDAVKFIGHWALHSNI